MSLGRHITRSSATMAVTAVVVSLVFGSAGPAAALDPTSATNRELAEVRGVQLLTEVPPDRQSPPVSVRGRPAWERIPAGVRTVTFTARGQTANGRRGPSSAPRVIRGHAVAGLVSRVNRLALVPPGATACPAAFFDDVRLSFRDAAGRTQATAVEQPTGCPSVSLAIAGRRGPLLADRPSVTSELERLGVIATCRSAALRASAAPPERAPGGVRLIDFTLVNRSSAVCALKGFPRLTLLDARSRRLSLHQSNDTSMVTAVALDPSQAATFSASYRTCGAPAASWARLLLPGVRPALVVGTGSRGRPFAPCGGRLVVDSLLGQS